MIVKLITRDTDYAVRALVYLAARNTRVVSVQELVRELNIPRAFLRRILQQLGRRGMLKVFRGKYGGFALGLPAKELKLLDLMKIFQGSFRLTECMFRKRVCPNRSTCVLKKRIRSIESYVVTELSTVTIETLVVHSGRK